jgi:hypothetical protein
MKSGINTVTHCALIVEVDGEVWQVILTGEESNQMLAHVVALCGGSLVVSEQAIESISLESV